MNIEFNKSEIDEYFFYRGEVIYTLYTDDSIISDPNQEYLDAIVADLKKANLGVTV